MSSIGAPQQHKQPSRKGKKAWRKNVDVTEIQDGLQTLREEVIQGGPLSEKKAEEIFSLDIVGSADIKKKYNLHKPLKVDQILAQRSAVPAVDSRKRTGSRLTDGVVEPSSKRLKVDWVSKKDVQKLKKSLNTTVHLGSDQLTEEASSVFDLWAAESAPGRTKEMEYVPKPKAKVAPQTLKKAPIPMTADGRPVRAVKNPDAGTSYNPLFEEWDNLLNREGEKEVAAEQARIRQAELEAEKQARIAAAADDDVVGRTDGESDWEGFETENEDMNVLRNKRPQRKTPAERNKIKRRKLAERQAKHEKRMGDQRKLTGRIEAALAAGSITKDGRDEALAQLENDMDGGDDSVLRRRRRGNAPIPEKHLELVLPEELQESLRLLKPEGNLLQDRFRNLLVNGKIESRKPVLQPKKKKIKFTEKWSHKDFSIPV